VMIAALFVSGLLLWLMFDIASRHRRDAVVMVLDPERFAGAAVAPQRHRFQGHGQSDRRSDAEFPSAAVC
jgi:hypothetical protein